MMLMHCLLLPNPFSWTCPSAVVRQDVFMCFGGVALGGSVKERHRIFFFFLVACFQNQAYSLLVSPTTSECLSVA